MSRTRKDRDIQLYFELLTLLWRVSNCGKQKVIIEQIHAHIIISILYRDTGKNINSNWLAGSYYWKIQI